MIFIAYVTDALLWLLGVLGGIVGGFLDPGVHSLESFITLSIGFGVSFALFRFGIYSVRSFVFGF